MATVTIYHNLEGRFEPYQDGQPLVLVLSYRLAGSAELDPQGIAADAFQFCNADLEVLEPRRDGGDGEVLFLAACVYRLLGRRSMSFPRKSGVLCLVVLPAGVRLLEPATGE